MASQTTYAQQPELQLGTINGVAPHTIVSMKAEEEITFGGACDRSATDPSYAVVKSAIDDAAENLFGIAVSQASVEAAYPCPAAGQPTNVSWPVGLVAGVIRDGVVTVAVDAAVSEAGPAYLSSGEFVASGSNALLNCFYEGPSVTCTDVNGVVRELVNVRIVAAAV